MTPPEKHICQGKMYLSKSVTTPKNKTSAKKNLLLFRTLNTQSMSYSICPYQSVSLSPSSQLVPSSCSHSLLTFPSSSLPFHNISSSVLCTALDIQHFLKPFTVTSGEMSCHVDMMHFDRILHVYFLFYKLTWTHEDSQFSPQMVLRLKICVFVSVAWSVWVHGSLCGF